MTATTANSTTEPPEADALSLRMWVVSALSAYEESKRRKWSFDRFLRSGKWGDECLLRDAFWLALTYNDWRDLYIPTGCPTEARRFLEAVLPAQIVETA